ncbi:DNA/RNA helicase domain-containing protein [Nocardia sp. NPDC051570]|uniref:DNA/RNA helicase domain-containing protein n=1 Tax=Nocardia sp. NPDC051570 TaxID=3364324 RepID=UPI00378957A5
MNTSAISSSTRTRRAGSAVIASVFLLDEHQVVRPDEIGTPKAIRDHAARKGYLVHHIALEGQFRCGGSAEYDEWVLQLIGLRHGKPTQWSGDDFDVRIARSPQQMEDFLRAQADAGAAARIAAGYCWPWTHEPRKDGTLEPDVVIGDWRKPWNKFKDTITGEAPPGWLWATDPRGFEQVGCIYTAQGFEYDWAGVILGPDIAVENGRLAVRRDATEDSPLRNKKLFDDDVEILIRNTYKVLLTRGLRGVVIYAVDPTTQELLTGLAPSL